MKKRQIRILAVGRAMAVALACTAFFPRADGQGLVSRLFPDEPDPFVGDWKGRWSDDVDIDPDVAAQVVALGKNKYRIRLVPMLDKRCPPKAVIEVAASRGRIKFDSEGYYGEISGDRFTGGKSKGKSTFEMTKVVRLSPDLGKAPPKGAIVLFDGSGFDEWDAPDGWELLDDGVMMVTPLGDYLISKRKFTDVRLHAEFRTPFMPRARLQQRGNSGVFVHDEYEVQVLDSYGLEGYYNECGALYKLSAPRVNMCAPPLQWQSFDISYRAPRHDSNGELNEFGRITVYHNGVLIQDDVELEWITSSKEEERLAPPPSEPGNIKLQAHGNYIQFRNIWVVDLSANSE